ncbi:hypothetical protein Tsubulata_040380 [Turnera subulata]|uniref:F-box domain-containing protein n=1 Tax=Turnera subulata TaxID=218843 RepID=A0A9Q0FCY6_9ROSI|nr:hypothetical protein Tsubulata_040380 [Turnera subulata]
MIGAIVLTMHRTTQVKRQRNPKPKTSSITITGIRTSQEMEVKHHPPLAIMEEILARLPIKSLIRFVCMSKEWYSYQVSGKLDQLRSKLAPLDHQLVRILDLHCSSSSLDDWEFKPSSSFRFWYFEDYLKTRTPLSFPMETLDCTYLKLVGSCNGLVCIALDSKYSHLVLWNPTTGVYRKLPRPDEGTSNYELCRAFCFGYDSVHDDYKIFLTWVLAPSSHGRKTQVFSLKANSWKKRSNDQTPELLYNTGLFLNGALHCILAS